MDITFPPSCAHSSPVCNFSSTEYTKTTRIHQNHQNTPQLPEYTKTTRIHHNQPNTPQPTEYFTTNTIVLDTAFKAKVLAKLI